MSAENRLVDQNNLTLNFTDPILEGEFRLSYNLSVKIPLRYGIILSILSWYSAIGLIYSVIPGQFVWLMVLTIVYIGAFFGFVIYATFKKRFERHLHFMGALSNAWAGLYSIYFCQQFPDGAHLTLPVLIFIIFFGSYMIRLRWIAGFMSALTYIIAYHIYIVNFSNLSESQVVLYAFVSWMTLIFAGLAGYVAEKNSRLGFIQQKTIYEQRHTIEKEKEVLLKEVHHRVKNNLQVIVSLINLQLSKIGNEAAEFALKETQSRILSMSLVHQRMNQSSNYGNIVFRDYIKELVENINALQGPKKVDFNLKMAEDIVVDIDMAIPLGLIVNEMVLNFLNHVQINHAREPRFSIEAVKPSKNEFLITYRDNGEGVPERVLNGSYSSFGLELIQSLTDQINGTFDLYNDKGAVYKLRISV